MRVPLILLGLFLTVAVRADVIYGKYKPTGTAEGDRPTVSWKVTPTQGRSVSRVEMLINEQPVAAEYNTGTSTVEYHPDEPLDEGLYSVVCRVTVERQVVVRQEWTFEVADNVRTSAGPTTSFAANYAFEATNAIRAEMGMPDFALDHRISAAAAAHSKYQILNGQTCHFEDPSKPGFTGKAPWDRIQRFGFPGVCYEGACGNQMDPRKAIRLLFDAPYHRIAFLQPGSPAIGVGFESGALTVDYAVSEKEGLGLSPAPGQKNIPLGWDGNESPSPLRIHGVSGACGYPIVFSWFSPRLENIRISSMSLTGPRGATVPAHMNTPSNDTELRFTGVIIPKTKLQPNTTYRVEVRATTERGKNIDRTWSFTTGS